MPLIATSDLYTTIDVTGSCRNWIQDYDDGDKRQSSKADAVKLLAESLNRALARYPRVTFRQTQPITSPNTHDADNVGAAPLYRWMVRDNVPNANVSHVRAVVLTRQVENVQASNGYAAREAGGTVSVTPVHTGSINQANICKDVFAASYDVNRAGAAEDHAVEGINTYGGYTMLDVVVQDREWYALDSGVRDVVLPDQARVGGVVMSDLPSNIAAKLDRLRRNNLPIHACWSARSDGGDWINVSSSNAHGVVGTNTVLANLQDLSCDARSATSPGITCAGYLAGRGLETVPAGQTVKLECRVFATSNVANSDEPANIVAWGPCGNVAIPITANVAPEWYGNGVAFVYLNSAIKYVDNTIQRNKVDLFHAVASAGDSVRVYAYSIEGVYE